MRTHAWVRKHFLLILTTIFVGLGMLKSPVQAQDVAVGNPDAPPIYWAGSGDSFGTTIIRRLNGSNVEDIVTTEPHVVDIAFDIGGGKMYWAIQTPNTPTGNSPDKIFRANLDGSNAENIINTGGYMQAIALDVQNGKIYYTPVYPSAMYRANTE